MLNKMDSQLNKVKAGMRFPRINVDKNLKIKHPATILVAGATGSGKTHFVRNVVEHSTEMLSPQPTLPIRVLWVFGARQSYKPLENNLVAIEYSDSLPESFEGIDILVLDDLQNDLSGSKVLSDIYTKISHHSNMTVIFIVQNIFNQGQQMRNISLNSHYLVLTKNRRDLMQVKTLGNQLYGETSFFSDAYKKAVLDREYGYLLVDLTPTTEEKYRLRTSIFPGEDTIIFQRHVKAVKGLHSDSGSLRET